MFAMLRLRLLFPPDHSFCGLAGALVDSVAVLRDAVLV
jgi:hypothetical protein